MRYLLRVLMGVWVFIFVASSLASSGVFHPQCGASLEFEIASSSTRRNFRRYDFAIGLSYYRSEALVDANTYSPNALYSYDATQRYTVNDDNVFLVNNTTLERQFIFGSPNVFDVFWSQDNRSLWIWEHNRETSQTIFSSYDIETLAVNFQLDLDAVYPIGQSPDYRYVYAQFFLDERHEMRGVLFVDTVTGAISRFHEPTNLDFLWSADSRWVASHFQGNILIIDPISGDFHPQLAMPIQGAQFMWQQDNLWFTRLGGAEGNSVWRASLSDGSVDLMIEDARLEGISSNERWAYIYDGVNEQKALYNLVSGRGHPLDMRNNLRGYRDSIWFSPNGRCAILIMSRGGDEYLIVNYALQPFRQTHVRELEDTLLNMRWVESHD